MTSAAPVPFAALYKSVALCDSVECFANGATSYSTLIGSGMYAIDRDGQPWALVCPVDMNGGYHWVLLNELLDGTAAKRYRETK